MPYLQEASEIFYKDNWYNKIVGKDLFYLVIRVNMADREHNKPSKYRI